MAAQQQWRLCKLCYLRWTRRIIFVIAFKKKHKLQLHSQDFCGGRRVKWHENEQYFIIFKHNNKTSYVKSENLLVTIHEAYLYSGLIDPIFFFNLMRFYNLLHLEQ